MEGSQSKTKDLWGIPDHYISEKAEADPSFRKPFHAAGGDLEGADCAD